MNVAVIVPYAGKRKYQNEYNAIVAAIEHEGHTVLSPEKPQQYKQGLAYETRLHDTPRDLVVDSPCHYVVYPITEVRG